MSLKRTRRKKPMSVASQYCATGNDPDGITKEYIDPWIGYGLFATKPFAKGDFIGEYRGILTDAEDVDDDGDTVFQYYFTFKGKSLCIDASESSCLVRYANDDSKGGNSAMKVIDFEGQPHLCLFATAEIKPTEEFRYSYGVNSLPWRTSQHKKWPHRLIERNQVSMCSVCLSPMSSIKWIGLSCIDCLNAWHNSCFEKLNPQDRCCLPKKEKEICVHENMNQHSQVHKSITPVLSYRYEGEDTNPKEKDSADSDSIEDTQRKEKDIAVSDSIEDTDSKENDSADLDSIEDTNPKENDSAELSDSIEDADPKEKHSAVMDSIEDTDPKGKDSADLDSIEDTNRKKKDSAELSDSIEDTDPKEKDSADLDRTEDINPNKKDSAELSDSIEDTNPKEKDSAELLDSIGDTDPKEKDSADLDSIEDTDPKEKDSAELSDSIENTSPKEKDKAVSDSIGDTNPKEKDSADLDSIEDTDPKEKHSAVSDSTSVMQEDEVKTNVKDSNKRAMLMLFAMSNPCQNKELVPTETLSEIFQDSEERQSVQNSSCESQNQVSSSSLPTESTMPKAHANESCFEDVVPDSEDERCMGSERSSESDSDNDDLYIPTADELSSNESEGEQPNLVPDACAKVSSSQQTLPEKPTIVTRQTPYKKPYRCCPFCNTPKSKLSQHIATQHKDIDCVAKALLLPKREKLEAMDAFKKQGILKVNKEQAKTKNPTYQRERSGKTDSSSQLQMCGICSGFYAKTYIRRHTIACQGDASVSTLSIPVSAFACEDAITGGEFGSAILSKFRSDDVGKICTTDPVLLMIGQKLWCKQKRKADKKAEVRRSVMTDMRRLASLYSELLKQESVQGALPVKQGNLADLFSRSNFRHLEGAIEVYTTEEEGNSTSVKAGLKMAVYYLLKSASKILKGSYFIDDRDEDAKSIDKFVAILELNHNYIFGDALYKTEKQRQIKLRRPESLPQERDIRKLRDFTVQRMEQLASDDLLFTDKHRFVELRDLVVCRLTLYNARRGGEPARLLLQEWNDAENGSWLDANQLDNLEEVDKALASTLHITYQSGKGNKHLVPVLFPTDTLQPIRKLCSEEWRSAASIHNQNPYLFPSTNSSENHVSGWHSVFQCCEKVELENKSLITATKNRHRISTLFALMDVKESDREFLYKHLGHSSETNRNIYQTPLAIKELTVVGKRLQTIDEEAGPSGICCLSRSAPSSSDEGSSTENEVVSSSTNNGPENPGVTNPDNPVTYKPTKAALPDIPECHAAIEESAISSTLDVTKARKYSKWTNEESVAVRAYFQDYYKGSSKKKLPGRKDVLKFLSTTGSFRHDWKTVHSKVMNDIRLRQQRADKAEKNWE